MSTYPKPKFDQTLTGIETRQSLLAMARDAVYKTDSSYTANAASYPTNQRSFVDKHMDYLSAHPATNPEQYLANLRLMTRVR